MSGAEVGLHAKLYSRLVERSSRPIARYSAVVPPTVFRLRASQAGGSGFESRAG